MKGVIFRRFKTADKEVLVVIKKSDHNQPGSFMIVEDPLPFNWKKYEPGKKLIKRNDNYS